MGLNPGDSLLDGHYRIVRLLGRGGFGFVYQAQDVLLGEQVAIKELIPALVGDEVMLKRFLAEARATMRLRHKRIVGTHSVFSDGDNYYIVMEYMPGGSLEEGLRQHGSLCVDEAVQIASEICQGLAHAHDEGVVHCDLKPANILFAADGRAKVADFGIAHISGEMLTRSWRTPAGFVAGTLPYMSPEQTEGLRDDPRIDVYAVGAILYRMLTGCTYLDFDQQETPRAQALNVARIFDEQPLPPSHHNRSVSPWLDAIVLKTLAKKPEERYASVDELRAHLADGDMLRPPPVARLPAAPDKPKPATRPSVLLLDRYWPLLAGIVALVAGLTIGMVALSNLQAKQAEATTVPMQATVTLMARATTASSLTMSPLASLGETPGATYTVAVAPSPTLAPSATWVPTERPARTPTAMLSPTEPATPQRSPTPRPTRTSTPTATPDPLGLMPGAVRSWSNDDSTMVYVPAGSFWMGSAEGDPNAPLDDERPRHAVYLQAFWIDRTEVTNRQFQQCVAAGACSAPSWTRSWTRDRYYDSEFFEDYPIINTRWEDARDYCAWAGKRLPTEAEWEKAARGTDGRTYPWGEEIDCSLANYNGKDGVCLDDTAPVGHYPNGASPYGVLDMAGNVAEWVNDWYSPDYYSVSPSQDPQGPSSGQLHALRGELHVIRGGSWYYDAFGVRAALRKLSDPGWSVAQDQVGFRCALSMSP